MGYCSFSLQTDADRKLLATKGSVPIGIGKNTHIKRAIIDKNARIGDDVKVCNSIQDDYDLLVFEPGILWPHPFLWVWVAVFLPSLNPTHSPMRGI